MQSAFQFQLLRAAFNDKADLKWRGVKEKERGQIFLLATSSDAAHTILKLCVRLNPGGDSVTCPTHRSMAPDPKPFGYLL
jgi:hypothetical protein